MRVIRPITLDDLDDLLAMARGAGKGMTNLPPDRDLLAERIQRSRESFARQLPAEKGRYLFAMEDTEAGRCVGVCGIEARVGLEDVWYNYRLSTTVNVSRELGVHVQTDTLYLTNDMTGATEICCLLLDPDWRGDGNGPFLSRCRFLFLADFPDHFARKVFAEMRGVSDSQGRSPFWDALGERFFSLPFHEADLLSARGDKAFIAELMPKYPIYLPLLNPQAREVVGRVHDNTRPALHMLEAEGFDFNGLVDIFDAGPVVEAFIHNIRAVRDSQRRHVLISREASTEPVPPAERIMVSNGAFADFRVITVPARRLRPDTVSLTAAEARALGVAAGDQVRHVRLKHVPPKREAPH